MFSSRKVVAALVGLLALSLTIFGIVYAVSDTNPSGASDANLKILQGSPSTGVFAITMDTGQQYNVTATIKVDFNNDAFSGDIAIPAAFSTTHIDFVEINGILYLGIPSLGSLTTKPWLSISLAGGAPDLFPLAAQLAFVKSDMIYFVNPILGTPTLSHSGPLTTYSYAKKGLSLLPKLISMLAARGIHLGGATQKLPTLANVALSVTIASKGQIAAMSLRVAAGSIHFNLGAQVLSYDHRVSIVAPPANQVERLTRALERQLLTSPQSPLSQLLPPSAVAALGQLRAA